jgi:hypothetical protein
MRMITAAAYVAAVITAIAACGGSQPKAAASHAATRTSASASASSTLDMTGIPVITVDANGNYWALVPESKGIGDLQRICSHDQPQLLQRLKQAGAPATGALVDLHGPGNPTGNTTGNTYALGSGDFAIMGNNEGLCGVMSPGG